MRPYSESLFSPARTKRRFNVIRRHLNVMDVVKTSKQPDVRTGSSLVSE